MIPLVRILYPKASFFRMYFIFTIAGVKCHVATVKILPLFRHNAVFSYSLGSPGTFWEKNQRIVMLKHTLEGVGKFAYIINIHTKITFAVVSLVHFIPPFRILISEYSR